MTTHSNHLINVASLEDQVAVFTFQKAVDENAMVVIRRVDARDREPLLLLGAQPASVMLSNCTIWVEGISDRLVLRHFLKLYMDYLGDMDYLGEKRIREDLHYIFMEYSGGNIAHWSFLSEDGISAEYLCSVAFVVTDSDGRTKEGDQYVFYDEHGKLKANDGKAKRLNTLKDKLQEHVYVLPVREFENLYQPELVENYVLSCSKMAMYNGDGEPPRFVFEEKQLDRWPDEYVGTLIHLQCEAFGYDVEKINKFAGVQSDGDENTQLKRRRGTLTTYHKKNLADYVVDHCKSFLDLSEEAKALTKAMYRFIVSKNEMEPFVDSALNAE